MKPAVLFLCHRLPFPPNKGDKITTCNILRFLHQHFRVYLGCFLDDESDRQFIPDVEALTEEACIEPLTSLQSKLNGLRAFPRREPITPHYYRSNRLKQWVDAVIEREGIDRVLVYSGCMAQFVTDSVSLPQYATKVMHFADIDSDKWRQYAEKRRGIMRWVFEREARLLAEYERKLAAWFSTSCFISDAETALFRASVPPAIQPRIQTLSNGIDCDFFDPDAPCECGENYDLNGSPYVVFTGAMDYWANQDAVKWFVRNVWPKVRAENPTAHFYIVGSKPTADVEALGHQPGVTVTGRVEDVRPYLLNAAAAVAPMQIARGIQNKIIEAMAMELPVATTPLGIEGLEGHPDKNVHVTSNAQVMADWLIGCLRSERKAPESRTWLLNNFGWNARLLPLLSYLGQGRAAKVLGKEKVA